MLANNCSYTFLFNPVWCATCIGMNKPINQFNIHCIIVIYILTIGLVFNNIDCLLFVFIVDRA